MYRESFSGEGEPFSCNQDSVCAAFITLWRKEVGHRKRHMWGLDDASGTKVTGHPFVLGFELKKD